MITPDQTKRLLLKLDLGGLRPPESMTTPRGLDLAASVYADALNHAGITLPEAEEAAVAYLAEPDPGQYPKPWPDPGKLIARTPRRRAQAAIPEDGDALWHLALKAAGRSWSAPARYVEDPGTDAAIRAGLEAVGGHRALAVADSGLYASLSRMFAKAANAERARQRSGELPAGLLTATPAEAK